jgi:hypothetical protein
VRALQDGALRYQIYSLGDVCHVHYSMTNPVLSLAASVLELLNIHRDDIFLLFLLHIQNKKPNPFEVVIT